MTGRSDQPPKKRNKKKKKAAMGLLSFGEDENEDDEGGTSTPAAARSLRTSAEASPEPSSTARKLTPNPKSGLPPPRALTKAALAAEAAERERLRKEFLEMQEAVKESEIAVPFVFYDGANIPGGTVKVKKGDHIWLLLERCRKVGAELGVSGSANGSGASLKSIENSKKQWARVGVDDLMCVRGEVIVPHVSCGTAASCNLETDGELTHDSTTSFITLSPTRSLIRRGRVGCCSITQTRWTRKTRMHRCCVYLDKRRLRDRMTIQR